MAQLTFVDGDVLTASQINTYLRGEGGAWTTHTPQIDQGASTNIAKTVNYSSYARYGRTIVWATTVTLSAAGTAGSAFTLTLPVTAADSLGVTGSGYINDTSTGTLYVCTVLASSTTQVQMRYQSTSGWGIAPNLALASGDSIRLQVTYEAAS